MHLEKGMVVRSKAGHDKGWFFVTVGFEDGFALIADGRSRTLDRPKKKNPIHLSLTSTVIDLQSMTDDSEVRKILAVFNGRVRTFKEVM